MFKFPRKLVQPIENYLKREDPFSDPSHANENAASDTDAFEQSSHQRIESLQKELLFRIQSIANALFRIKKGKYGFCEKCGKMISTERLNIVPTAALCVSCEKKKAAQK